MCQICNSVAESDIWIPVNETTYVEDRVIANCRYILIDLVKFIFFIQQCWKKQIINCKIYLRIFGIIMACI